MLLKDAGRSLHLRNGGFLLCLPQQPAGLSKTMDGFARHVQIQQISAFFPFRIHLSSVGAAMLKNNMALLPAMAADGCHHVGSNKDRKLFHVFAVSRRFCGPRATWL